MPNSTNNVLHAVSGYQTALDHQEKLAKTGTDYKEQKGVVANTIATLHPKRLQLNVIAVIDETPSTKTIRLAAPTGSLPPFQAGQYINLFVEINGTKTARPYAISSSAKQLDYYDLTVKRVDNGFVSNYLMDDVSVGDTFQSTGPMGTFYHNPLFHGDDLVFLAGGSGIAPARSMIEHIAFKRQQSPTSTHRMHLIYASSYQDDVIFEQELQQLDQLHSWLTISWVISRPEQDYDGIRGHLSAELITTLLTGEPATFSDKMFYICGPTSFHDYCAAQLAQLKVTARRVRIECNGPPKNPQNLPNWPKGLAPEQLIKVSIKGQGSFEARVDEPLLNSMERHGYSTENACRSGECSLCRVKVLSGEVFNPDEAKLRSTDKDYGWCHSCVAFPTSDIEIMI